MVGALTYGAAPSDALAREKTVIAGGNPAGPAPELRSPEVARAPLPPLAADTTIVAVPGPTGLVIAALGATGQEVVQVARLIVDGMDSDMWTGNVCVTSDGRYAAAVFAPAEFANRPELLSGGAFGAVIDMSTGDVRPVGQRVTMAYHNPGCGIKDQVAFTTHAEASDAATTVLEIDATDGRIQRRVPFQHQVTSAVPSAEGLTMASGRRIQQLATDGRVTSSADLGGPVFDLKASADGGVDALVSDEAGLTAIHHRRGRPAKVLGRGHHGQLRLATGRNGANRLVGKVTSLARGAKALDRTSPVQAVGLDGTLLQPNRTTGSKEVDTFTVTDAVGSRSLPLRTTSAPATFTTSSTTTQPPPNYTTPTCAVSRTDYQIQVAQPTPAQVEWAVHRVIRNEMTITRPPNWNLNGLPAYSPSSLGTISLNGGGRIPAQVLLGILAQESNLKQAGKGALPGVPGNPLVGNYYGVVYANVGYQNEPLIVGMNYDNADCGYGIGQITTGMTAAAGGPWSADQKKMIATDYTANIQAAALLLAEKWNLLRTTAYGSTVANDGDSTKIENWYFAMWGYNSGIYAMSAPDSPHGVGWLNNPANPYYDPGRSPFLRETYADAATPYKWPYRERVLGWARTPQLTYKGEPAYTGIAPPPTGTYDEDYQPDPFSLCVMAVNKCDPNNAVPDDPSTPVDEHRTHSYCTDPDRVCWWHGPAMWPVGHTENSSAYLAGTPEPAVGPSPHPPACSDPCPSPRASTCSRPDHGADTNQGGQVGQPSTEVRCQVDPPEAVVGQVGEAGAVAVAERPGQGEDDLGGAGGVGRHGLGAEDGLVGHEPVEGVQAVSFGAGDEGLVERGVGVGQPGVEGGPGSGLHLAGHDPPTPLRHAITNLDRELNRLAARSGLAA